MTLIEILIEIYSSIKKFICNIFIVENNINDGNKNCNKINNKDKYNFILSNDEKNVKIKSYDKISSIKLRFSETKEIRPMDGEEFRKRGKEVIDYMVNLRDTVKDRPVIPDVHPGYLRPLLPTEPPKHPDRFETIMQDFETKILKGTVFWTHPRFHAYFPSGNSYPSMIGDMLSGVLGSIGFSWPAGPSTTELEIVVLDWFAKAMGLPQKFLSTEKGAGVLQGSASDCIMTVFLAARYNAIEALKKEFDYDEERKVELLPKLVAYTSKESHSCVEKAAKLCLVKLRILEVTDEGNVSAETLEKAMKEDEEKGLKPFLYSSIFGSTSQTSFDDLEKLAPVCRKRPDYFWIHVDAAYAGSAFICPEMRRLATGIEHANSFNVNPNKWMLVNFDCSCLYVDDELKFTESLVVDPIYLQHPEISIIDRRHFHIALSRRMRSLKLWFVFRMYGILKLQEYLRHHIKLAKYFEQLVRKDDRFEVTNIVTCGLVCFRLKAGNQPTQDLLTKINGSAELHMTPTKIKYDRYVIRFCVCYEEASQEDMDIAWGIIQKHAEIILTELAKTPKPEEAKRTLFQRRLSFTRSISKEQYEKRSSSLYDGATPILVVEEDGDEHNVFDDVFVNSLPSTNHEQNDKDDNKK